MGDLLGYARVSTIEQKARLQTDALEAAGCIRRMDRQGQWHARAARSPQLARVLDHLRPGDTLCVWRLDRLGRNLRHLIATVTDLSAREVGFRSLTEGIDTTTPAGRLIFHVFGALAEFEAALIRERTTAGLAAARARGRTGGRPRAMTPEQVGCRPPALRRWRTHPRCPLPRPSNSAAPPSIDIWLLGPSPTPLRSGRELSDTVLRYSCDSTPRSPGGNIAEPVALSFRK